MNVVFGVCNVIVSANNQVGPFLSQHVNPIIEIGQETHFHPLPQLPAGSGRKITVQSGDVSKIGTEYAPFYVINGQIDANGNQVSFYF